MKQYLFGTSAIFAALASSAIADITVISENQHIAIVADNDNTGDGNINMYSSGNLAMTINDSTTDINYGLNVDGATDLNSTLNVDGATTLNSSLTVSGNSDINSSIFDVDSNVITLDASGEDSSVSVTATGSNGAISLDSDHTISGTSGVITFTANGSDPGSDQSFAVLANQDIDFTSTNDDILMGAGDDIQMSAANNITMTSLNNDVEIDAADDIEMKASQDFELTKQLGEDSSGNFYGSGIIALQGSNANRYVADDNGKIVLVDESTAWSTEFDGNEIETSASNVAAGTSAQLLVGDTAGNMRGLVVQENKTTLSGGQNAASLSLDANGATFSNPTDGRPIQVHGVADGSAPFDAVNVRQLYSGLAAVMAAGTPELRLEPGKTSAAIGVGHYGGYSGVGFGLGHMYDNGTVVTMSVGKAKHSETAIKGSVSWTW